MIRFGTSGWRGVMGEDFTFHNVRVVVQAATNYLKAKHGESPVTVVVGYDTRFLSDRYALEAAKLLARNGIRVLLSDRDAPSQALACQIIKRRCQGGINFTASFNPPRYNGLKFNAATGAPALPAVTDAIEEEVRRLMPGFTSPPSAGPDGTITRIDLQSDYLCDLQGKIDFAALRAAGLKIVADPLYGTSREYLDEILEENGVEVESLHGYIDPYFGGVSPSCTEENLAELKARVVETGARLGLATDADGDRFGIVDETGAFVHPNVILALLLDYLVRVKGLRGGVARSVTTTHLLDRIARRYELPLTKTKVGFKYMAELFLQGQILFGGEESACIAVRDHLPEKDGIFAGLLVAEMVAAAGRGLADLRRDLFREYGELTSGQRTLPLTPERAKRLKALVKDPPAKLGRRKVTAVETIDGLKLDFDGDRWLVVRMSGTEPLIRCYAEAETCEEVEALLKKGLEAVR
ncbi:MAG: phosphoglucomutase/phosphomannomutase family protein [Candidatus Aminicenantes bacterium]|nr:phosphoglucomutase/phosphomannomutase family protein [Candidatus Aminicenantes bacterium]NLH77118.1 phosphoglucomutase/phosphomannomutase family protein [Acidobacteriota bacterium]